MVTQLQLIFAEDWHWVTGRGTARHAGMDIGIGGGRSGTG